MPIMTEEHLNARRTQILKAATKCFSEKGFIRTTMRDICRTAELSTGAVYNYFSGKDDIIEKIGRLSIEENRAVLSAAAASDTPLKNVIKTFVSYAKSPAYLEIIGFNFELFAESRTHPQIAHSLLAIIKAAIDQIREIVRQEQDGGKINPDLDPLSVAQVLWSQLMGLNVLAFMDRDVNIDSLAEVVDAAYEGIISSTLIKGN